MLMLSGVLIMVWERLDACRKRQPARARISRDPQGLSIVATNRSIRENQCWFFLLALIKFCNLGPWHATSWTTFATP